MEDVAHLREVLKDGFKSTSTCYLMYRGKRKKETGLLRKCEFTGIKTEKTMHNSINSLF